MRTIAPFAVVASMMLLVHPAEATPEEVCKAVLGKWTLVSRCGFITERSGVQYYSFDVDQEAARRVQAVPNTDAQFQLVAPMLVLPATIMDLDEDHPFASVRMNQPGGGSLELTRQQYQECMALYGQPMDLALKSDGPGMRALGACTYNKMKKVSDAGPPSN